MSIMDVDKADEKIDYEIIYKKRFEEIENNIEVLQRLYSVDNGVINKLSSDVNFLKDEVFRHGDILYKIKDNMEILRTNLNILLPKDQQIFFKDIISPYPFSLSNIVYIKQKKVYDVTNFLRV